MYDNWNYHCKTLIIDYYVFMMQKTEKLSKLGTATTVAANGHYAQVAELPLPFNPDATLDWSEYEEVIPTPWGYSIIATPKGVVGIVQTENDLDIDLDI